MNNVFINVLDLPLTTILNCIGEPEKLLQLIYINECERLGNKADAKKSSIAIFHKALTDIRSAGSTLMSI